MTISLTLPFLSLLGFSLQLAQVAKVRWVTALPTTLSIILILLYLVTPFKLLYQATWVIYVLGILCLAFYTATDTQAKFTELKKYSKEIIIFLFLSLVFGFYIQDKVFHAWDDFSHWGVFSSELLTRNFFESQDVATSIIQTHAHYPRGSSIYHYLILLPAGFSEGGALFAHFMLYLIFLSPLFQNKQAWQSLILILASLVVMTHYTTALRSIYNDSTVGLIFSTIFIINILEFNKTKALALSLPILILLPLFREIGLILAVFAAIILTIYQIRNNSLRSVSLSVWILILLTIILPIAASNLWINYFKSTHDFFGRVEHSFSNLVGLIKSFDTQHKSLLINYLKFFGLFLVKEGSLVIYALIAASWYGVKKYRKDLIPEYKFFIFNLGMFFILFAMWRLYLYYFTFAYHEAIKGASLSRYLGSYCIVFALISCAYIKKTYFDVDRNKSQNTILNLIVIFLIICSSIQVINTVLRAKETPSEFKGRNKQIEIIKEFIANDYEVEFNFENKPYDNWNCYYINYKIAPYFKSEIFDSCIKAPAIQKEQIQKPLDTTFEYDLAKLLKDKCKIFYSPFMNKLEINCSE